MAIPAHNIDLVEAAALLGWVTQPQAKEAIALAWRRAASSRDGEGADAFKILMELGFLDEKGRDAVERREPRSPEFAGAVLPRRPGDR
jgi:hypothetical protein